jgi:glycosyltransferase involved in cell wall biosynthesis
MAKKNLLLLAPAMHIGGAELVVANLCKFLDRDLFDVTVCHIKDRGDIGEELAAAGYDVVGLSRPRLPFEAYLSSLKLRRVVKERGIDVIHSHGTAPLADASVCKLLKPGLGLVHTFHFGNYPHRKMVDIWLERAFWRVPQKLIAVGTMQQRAIQKTYGIPDGRIGTIYNGVERRTAALDRELLQPLLDSGKAIIGSISTMIEQKGITHLLDTAAALRELRDDFLFLVIGDGPLRASLEAKRDELGLREIVHFSGWVKDAAIRALPAFDIFFQPSLWEAMSMVVLEAMAESKPVVATSVGENPFMIADGETGFVVEPGDVPGMTGRLEQLVGDPALRESMGRRAGERHEVEYNVGAMVDQYSRLYSEITSP